MDAWHSAVRKYMHSPQPKRDFWPNLVLTDLVFWLLVIAHWYFYKDIQGGVELSPLMNLKKKTERKSKTAAISQGQAIS